jgi:hypothetical protein
MSPAGGRERARGQLPLSQSAKATLDKLRPVRHIWRMFQLAPGLASTDLWSD